MIYSEYGSNIIIEDCRTESTQGSGIGIWGSSHVLIDGNEVIAACINGMQEHITVAGTDDFEVRNNRIHDTAPGTNGKEGICTKDGSSNGTVHHNEIYNLKRPGIYVDAWDKHTFNIRLYANRVHDVQADGFAIASELGGQLENIVVENNLSYDNMVGIVISFCCEYGGPLHPLKNVTIINNTCVRNGYDPWGGGIAVENEQIEGVVIRNNLVSGSFTFQLAANASLPVSKLVIDHNLISNFLDGEGETRGTDCVEGDPRFRDGSSDDFHLQPGSPAIDAGSEASAPANDYDGKSRPRDGNGDGVAASDIGAFESYSVRRRPARR